MSAHLTPAPAKPTPTTAPPALPQVVHIAALPQFGNASAPTTAAATAAATAAGGGLAAGASLHGGTANLPNPAGGPGTGPRWAVRFRQAMRPGQSPDVGELKTMECDVVVMATGMYFSPYVPFVQVRRAGAGAGEGERGEERGRREEGGGRREEGGGRREEGGGRRRHRGQWVGNRVSWGHAVIAIRDCCRG